MKIEMSVDVDGLSPEDRLKFEDMVQTQINYALKGLNLGEACICEYARYRYHKPDFISITGD